MSTPQPDRPDDYDLILADWSRRKWLIGLVALFVALMLVFALVSVAAPGVMP